jgi:hypothetical protein
VSSIWALGGAEDYVHYRDFRGEEGSGRVPEIEVSFKGTVSRDGG